MSVTILLLMKGFFPKGTAQSAGKFLPFAPATLLVHQPECVESIMWAAGLASVHCAVYASRNQHAPSRHH